FNCRLQMSTATCLTSQSSLLLFRGLSPQRIARLQVVTTSRVLTITCYSLPSFRHYFWNTSNGGQFSSTTVANLELDLMVIDAKGVQRERPSESFASIVTDVFGPEAIGIIDESRITLLYDTEIELFDDLFYPSGLYKRRGT